MVRQAEFRKPTSRLVQRSLDTLFAGIWEGAEKSSDFPVGLQPCFLSESLIKLCFSPKSSCPNFLGAVPLTSLVFRLRPCARMVSWTSVEWHWASQALGKMQTTFGRVVFEGPLFGGEVLLLGLKGHSEETTHGGGPGPPLSEQNQTCEGVPRNELVPPKICCPRPNRTHLLATFQRVAQLNAWTFTIMLQSKRRNCVISCVLDFADLSFSRRGFFRASCCDTKPALQQSGSHGDGALW